jgi:16S rRNA (uracil1498-N3)-methyltransferase
MGVASLIVFASRHSVARWTAESVEHKLVRLREVVRGACAQCGRTVEPSLRYAPSCGAVSGLVADHSLRLALDASAARPLAAFFSKPSVSPVCLLSGPEGGLAAAELEELSAGGWQTAHLGPRILRAETAALAAIAVAQGLAGDLGSLANSELQ